MSRAPEGNDPRSRLLSVTAQPLEMRAVGGNHRDPTRREPGKDLRFGIGDRLLAAKVLDMRGGDGGDHRDMRADMAGQRRDLAGVVHPHLEHAEAAARGHPRETERHADMVVVAADRTVCLSTAGAFERCEDRFLDPGLAHRSGHPDDLGAATIARGGGKRVERGGGVGDQDMRVGNRPVDQRGAGAISKGGIEEAVAIHRLALQCHE